MEAESESQDKGTMVGEVGSDSVSVIIEGQAKENVLEALAPACMRPHPFPRVSCGRRNFFRFLAIFITPVSFLYGGVPEHVCQYRSAHNAFFNLIHS